jgi:TRAP transporter TAXI family solute receptor
MSTNVRNLRTLTLPCMLALASAACAGGDGGGRSFMSLGTAGTGGLYYPIGGALASRLSVRDSARTYTAEVTGGSVENIQRLQNREMDLAFVIGTTMFEAYNGGTDFEQPQQWIRIIAPLYPNLTHVLVREGESITSVADLRGRRVSVGPGGSGTEQLARHVLEAYGLSYDDVDERFLSFTESASALADAAIDAAIITVGYPASAVLEATTTGRVRLLPIDSAHTQILADRYPYYSPGDIPAGTYPGQDSAVATFAVMNWVVARDDLPADVATNVLDILADELDQLRQAVEIAGQIRLTNLYAAPIPLHDAARAWLDARGEELNVTRENQ